ncbi:DUF1349 domain-containing protein [Bacillus sp. S10(2024)]
MEPNEMTDYWQKTHYVFAVDNGHFLYTEMNEDVIIMTRVRSHPVHQYDQAGLMVRFSKDCWIKTSIEYEPNGPCKLGVVVTNYGYSDWSTQNYSKGPLDLYFRIRRESGDYIVEFLEVEKDKTLSPSELMEREWNQLRIARLTEDIDGQLFQCGVYACSPQGRGFVAEFDFLSIEKGILAHRYQAKKY